MTWISSVGRVLAGSASSTRASSAPAPGAGDVGLEVPIAEIERAGSSIDVLRDADAPDRQLRIGYAVDGSEVGDGRACKPRSGLGTAGVAACASEVATRRLQHPNPWPCRTRRRGPCCRCRTSSWRHRPGSTNAWCPSWWCHPRSPSSRWRCGHASLKSAAPRSGPGRTTRTGRASARGRHPKP